MAGICCCPRCGVAAYASLRWCIWVNGTIQRLAQRIFLFIEIRFLVRQWRLRAKKNRNRKSPTWSLQSAMVCGDKLEKLQATPLGYLPHWNKVNGHIWRTNRPFRLLFQWGRYTSGVACSFSSLSPQNIADWRLHVGDFRLRFVFARNRHWRSKTRISINKNIRWANRWIVPLAQDHRLSET